MPRRPLAVVQFGQFPDGFLPPRYDDSSGWGATSTVRMDAFLGDWPPLHTALAEVDASPGRVVSGLLRPRQSPLASIGPGMIGEAAAYSFAGLTVPEAGDFEAQLGVPAGVERPQNPSSTAVQGVAVGFQVAGGTKGVMVVWADSQQVFFLFQWNGDGSTATITYSADTPDEKGRIGLRWAAGEVQATLNGNPVTRNAANGGPIPAVDLPDDPSGLEAFVMAYQFGIFADSFGISWAAVTESIPATAPVPPVDAPGAPGWALHAATRDGRSRGEIPADTWTWTWRLNDSSEVSWSKATPGGPKIRPHTTFAQVRYNGRVVQSGPVGPTNRTATEDGAVPGTWRAGDRIAQLQTRIIYPTSTLAWVDAPLGTVLTDLIGDCNALPGGDTAIRVDPAITGPTISLTVAVRDNIRKAIDAAVDLAGGEWWIDRYDTLRWSEAGRGGQRAFLADYGGAAVAITEATDPAGHGNALWVTGQNGTAVYRQDAAGVAAGRVDLVVSDPGQTHPGTLAARADRLLEDAAAMRPAYTATLRPDAWSPSKLSPGDVAHLVAPTLGVDQWLRVYEVAVTVTGDSPQPTDVKVTFGAPRPDFVRRMVKDRARIATLERR